MYLMWDGKNFAIGVKFHVPIVDEKDSEFQKIVSIFKNAGVDVEVINNSPEAYAETHPDPEGRHKWIDKEVIELLSDGVDVFSTKHGVDTSKAWMKFSSEKAAFDKWCFKKGIQTPTERNIRDFLTWRELQDV